MKLLAAFLVFMIAAQPVQAGYCDMDPSADSSAAGGQQHHAESSGDGHGCCDPDNGDGDSPCSDQMHCGACSSSAAVILPLAEPGPTPDWSCPPVLRAGAISPSHAAPPYRPPILIS